MSSYEIKDFHRVIYNTVRSDCIPCVSNNQFIISIVRPVLRTLFERDLFVPRVTIRQALSKRAAAYCRRGQADLFSPHFSFHFFSSSFPPILRVRPIRLERGRRIVERSLPFVYAREHRTRFDLYLPARNIRESPSKLDECNS